MGPLARQSWQQILALRQLNLQLALIAARPLREDIENELTAINNANLERCFQVALLRWGEIFVDDDQICVSYGQTSLYLVDLAAADQGRRSHMSDLLSKFG